MVVDDEQYDVRQPAVRFGRCGQLLYPAPRVLAAFRSYRHRKHTIYDGSCCTYHTRIIPTGTLKGIIRYIRRRTCLDLIWLSLRLRGLIIPSRDPNSQQQLRASQPRARRRSTYKHDDGGSGDGPALSLVKVLFTLRKAPTSSAKARAIKQGSERTTVHEY